MDFLRQEGPVTNLLNRMIDLILLSAVSFLCSLPIFTIGASVTALYDVTMNYALHQDVGIFAPYFRAFKKYFRRSMELFFIAAAAGLFIAFDLWAAFLWQASFRYAAIVVIIAVAYFYIAEVSHVFPVLAYFDLSVKECIRNAFLLAMRNGINTVFIMIMDVLPILAVIAWPGYISLILFVWFIIGNALIADLNAKYLVRLFDPERVEKIRKEEGEQEQIVREEKARKQEDEKNKLKR